MLHEIIVVLGCNADTIRQTLEFAGTTIVVNPGFSHGQSTSLKAGLSKLSVECHGAMFLLGDQPLITPEIINQIINAFVASDSSVVAPYYNNRRGNPVIIARDLFHRLNSVSGDTGARSLIHDYENRMIKVRVPDDAIVFDVDTPADYAELLSREK